MAARFPGLTAFEIDTNACRFTAVATDTSRAAEIRRELSPALREFGRPGCTPVVAIRSFPLTRAELQALMTRVMDLLRPSDTGAQVYYLNVESGTFRVRVKNLASVARAERILRSDTTVPMHLLRIEPERDFPEADNPQPPPRGLYLAALNHLLHGWSGRRLGAAVYAPSLPQGFARKDLRGLPLELVQDVCDPEILIRFRKPRQLENGAYLVTFFASRPNTFMAPHNLIIRCDGDDCFVVGTQPEMSDYLSQICPARAQPPAPARGTQ